MHRSISILIFSLISFCLTAQHVNSELSTSINEDGSDPDPAAILDVNSSTKGILIPRLDTSAVASPIAGLMIFQPADSRFYYYNGTGWLVVGDGSRMDGFFFNVPKKSLGGGLDGDTSWATIGDLSVLFGVNSHAEGSKSVSIGFENDVLNERSQAIGNENEINGSRSQAIGSDNSVSHGTSIAIGVNNQCIANSATAMGFSNIAENGAVAVGFDNTSSDFASSSFGYKNVATGEHSIGIGYVNESTAENSISLGYLNDSEHTNTMALGFNNSASATDCISIGNYCSSEVYGLTVIGRHNKPIAGSAGSWNAADPAFVVGIGSDFYSNTNGLVILKNGNTGIGRDNPAAQLDVNGCIRFGNGEYFEDMGSWYIEVGGRLIPRVDAFHDLGTASFRWQDIYATNGTIQTSDKRDKTNINEIHYGLTEIMRLKPVSFNWKNDEFARTKIGLIAQDLQKVIPEVVKTHSYEISNQNTGEGELLENDRLGVYYSDIIPVIIRGIQEQQIMIEHQKKIISKQKNNNESLLDQINKINQRLMALEKSIHQSE